MSNKEEAMSNDEFTASNGLTIRHNTDTGYFEALDGPDGAWIHVKPAHDEAPSMIAMQEHFQVKRDKELGRWRSTADPEWVVYENGHDAAVAIHEPSGVVHDLKRGHVFPEQDTLLKISDGYFDAHPEPKPWHDAKQGEVWIITTENVADEVAVQVTSDGRFKYSSGASWPIEELAVTTARRIWPERKEATND